MNRTEEKLLKKKIKKKKARDITILFMCFIFFLVMIYITDIKTSEMMVKNDGKYAVFLNIENETDIRIDIAGETFKFNIEYIIESINDTLNWSKENLNKILNHIGS
ncbi:MAG: hypothetical protein PHC44_01245 [Lutispora sp.]|nr:hypothetical protein [Lutispora sp.]MDD4833348.1 hypothetical protein [Lutispora sp.]